MSRIKEDEEFVERCQTKMKEKI